jgi:hypothetical protein
MSVFAAFWRVSQSALSFLDLNESSSTQALYVNFGTQLTSQSELQVVLEMWLPAVYVQLSVFSASSRAMDALRERASSFNDLTWESILSFSTTRRELALV